ncbi:MAG TPA: glycosyltransferase [Thiolapillus brandeum]|uniref:Glycosyltransferase n=1 Tax=Thiolapillus brandeum TaxID=1076588 RepID=A0A831RZL9_9GAMM|nr:glycosyltransferase [Thiolapillus brandeum]
MTRTVDVIVPVYGGREELRRCLESVVGSLQRTPYRLVLINDASPDPHIADDLRRFAAGHDQVELLENAQNLGFVATVNRGMALSDENDVVLLNSDTEVANDWLDRLVRAADSDPKIGTLTPFSNNATICSFPRFCQSSPLPQPWDVASLDAVFARVNSGELVDIPTGVGFCQYIRRECLKQTGLFDVERFGRGYGEENDFCRRAARLGWRNVLCCDVFVFHEGGVSFSDEQAERVAHAQEILQQLHPDYHSLVEQHIRQNPAQLQRTRALIEMYRSSPRQKVLHLTHHLGGGTKKHIHELSDWLAADMDALVIRPVEGGGARLSFGATDEASDLFFSLPGMYPQLLELLRRMNVSHLHFHHTLGLETCLWGLPDDLQLPFDVTLHDYYFINAHPSQTDARGRYTPDLQAQASSYPLSVSIDEWQANQRRLLEKAQRVIAPSASVVKEFERHYPGLNYLVAWHPDSEAHMPWPAVYNRYAEDRPLRVLALGALSPEKGPDVLEAVALEARRQGLPLEFHLLGYAYRPLADAVVEHGAYSEADLEQHLQAIRPDLVWFTALWPETYSYTLSEMFLAGLPMVVPDIGAFPERVLNRPLTWVQAWDLPAGQWLQWFVSARDELAGAGTESHAWQDQPVPEATENFYRRQYLADIEPRTAPELTPLDDQWLENLLQQSRSAESGQGRRSRKEQLLLHLLTLRQGRVGRFVSRLVPVNIQRKLKRRLSRKPIHELQRK